jgi:hypothetical protein
MEWNGMEWNEMKLKCFLCIQAFQLSHTTLIRMSSSTIPATTGYRTYTILSWYTYQQNTPSHLHSIEHYNANCEEKAKGCEDYVMVLRDEVTRITGWNWTTGWAAQNCADTDGYVDVRTGKKYPYGISSFYDDIK